MYGSHLSIAGGMTRALEGARALRLDTVQVFTKNQQQWKATPLKDSEVAAWKRGLEDLGWKKSACGRAHAVVAHASYLINLASVSDELWAQSVGSITQEVERCEALGIQFLVHHPGAFKGGDLESGLARIVKAYGELLKRTRGFATVLCLEGTTGSGTHIGGRLEHLRTLRDRIAEATGTPERVAFCLDTCHLHAAGYDLSSADKARSVLEEIERVLDAAHVRVLHVNDSKAPAGSTLDRHEHLGQGTIGRAGFAAFLSHPAWDCVPKILETPKDEDKSHGLDEMNLRFLRGLHDPAWVQEERPEEAVKGKGGVGLGGATKAARGKAQPAAKSGSGRTKARGSSYAGTAGKKKVRKK